MRAMMVLNPRHSQSLSFDCLKIQSHYPVPSILSRHFRVASMLTEILSARNSKEFFEDQSIHVPGLTDSRDDLKSQEITPEPFFFVKTCDMGGQKVFINMCGCSEVAAPGHWQNGVPPELEESFSSMESRAEDGMQNLRFSLSCSDSISSMDKQGNLCKVYDVVFNLVVMRHSKVHKQLRTFLINMAMTWIRQKYHIELKPDEDAELQPSFPLLIDRASQPLRSQEVELVVQHEYICNKSINVPESVLSIQDSTTTLASNGTEGKAAVPLHQEILKQNLNVMEDQPCHHESSISASKKPCDLSTNVTSQGGEVQSTKENIIGIEQGVCTASFEKKKIACELRTCVPSHDIAMQNTGFCAKHTPLIQVKYLGCPVELVIMCLSFPSRLKLQDFQLSASNTKLYVEASSYEPIMVPLVFPTAPIEAKATFFELESLLEVYLPFLTHVELLV